MFSSKILRNSPIGMALFLAACVTPTDTPTTPQTVEPTTVAATTPAQANPVVAANFLGGGGNWDGVGGIKFRYTAIERDGEVYICGAYTGRGTNDIRRLSREVMRQATASVNGERIMSNMSFFREASNSTWNANLVGVETNCRTTGQSAASVPLNAVRVETRSGRYRVRG